MNYVVAITSNTHLFLNGKRTAISKHLPDIPPEVWQTISCGSGSKGERLYEWAFISWPHHEQPEYTRGWLVRRSVEDPLEHAFYFPYAPKGTPLAKLVEVAGSRCAIEECFEQAKQETALDEYEVRSWLGWYRYFVDLRPCGIGCTAGQDFPQKDAPDLIPITVPEVRLLIVRLVLTKIPMVEDVLDWSHWRSHHQYVARRSHYRKRGHDPPK